MTEALQSLELSLLRALESLHGCAALDGFFIAVSALGNGGTVFIAACLVLLCLRRTRVLGCAGLTALALDGLAVNLILKPLIARARPYALQQFSLLIPPPNDFSFPSGHTAAAFAFAFAMRPAAKLWHAALAFACLTGFSRLYLTVHFPTDVLCGALCGALCGRAALFLFKKALGRDIMI